MNDWLESLGKIIKFVGRSIIRQGVIRVVSYALFGDFLGLFGFIDHLFDVFVPVPC